MRSRYSAFALNLPGYLAATQQAPFDAAQPLNEGKWLGLTVHRAEGAQGEQRGEVEFTARYLTGNRLCILHERSQFERSQGRWLYTTGDPQRSEERVERNAPCPCGSGRKFKSCCA
jgi:SEC-C motif-containing protein